MPIINSKHSRGKKSSHIDLIYSHQCQMHFPRVPITLPPFVSTFLSSRWNDDDDSEPSPKKPPYKHHHHHHHHHHIRRRIPKRYSDIVSPSSTKIILSRKESTTREKHIHHNRSKANILRRHSLQPTNEIRYYFNSSKKKSREIKDHRSNQIIKYNDHLAQRMQAAMSSELMHSLNRNFVSGDRKQLRNYLFMPRSHSFNIWTSWNKKSERHSSYHFIPRVKINFDKENLLLDEPTPDYDEQNDDIFTQTIENDINEEPIADYDDPKPDIECPSDDKTITHSEQGISSSFIVPQTSINNTDEHIPPPPPPLPNLNTEQKKTTFRCRTIADKLSSDHKLILKDKEEETTLSTIPSKVSNPQYFHISEGVTLRKPSQILSRSHSVYGSISQLNNRETEFVPRCPKPLIADEQIQDGLSSPSSSIVLDNECQARSSSSKIYNDYKKRTSLTSIPSTITRNHSMIIHPMHTKIGLRSSTSSSSTNDKLTDMTLSSKQMNVCVINQLNEHLSTRFRKQQQQQESCSNNNNNNNPDQQNYDPAPELMTENPHMQSNVYDEPNDLPVINQISLSSIPPPPPPLPVGGFRPIIPSINRSSNSQRTSLITLAREAKNSDLVLCSNGTSTISSNLSDTRILRELRENPLFTRAKQHLEIEPGSNGRRSGRRSTLNLLQTDKATTDTVSYLRLDNCSKTNLTKSIEATMPKQLETIIMLPDELNTIIGKRTKSTNDINPIKFRSCTKPSSQTQCRNSELELIFQKRAQRSEQNLP